MTNDVAVFLDLDNLAIGAKQVNLPFNIHLVIDHIKGITGGRIVLRQAYGAGRQSLGLLQELAQAGFIVQSATRINNFSKNLADMQIAVNAMDTLVDGHQYNTYVLMSGDRDFTPLVQSLRKRGKHVIGVGVKHTTSQSLVELCDEYVYYEDLLPARELKKADLEKLVLEARDDTLKNRQRVRASVFKEALIRLSDGKFNNQSYEQGSFSKFLQSYPHLVKIQQEDSTTYVAAPGSQDHALPLHARYRAALKKQRLRVVLPQQRFAILHALIDLLSPHPDILWYQALSDLYGKLSEEEELAVSKNVINAMLLVARQAGAIRTLRGRSLSAAPIVLEIDGPRAFQEAVICVDNTYLRAILDLAEPFEIAAAALAIYDSEEYIPYLERIVKDQE